MKYTTIALNFLPSLVTARLGGFRLIETRYRDSQLEDIPIVLVGVDPPNILGLCEGDCDRDGDCKPGLKCFQRVQSFSPVPGCSGGAQDASLYDYCVRNSHNFPALTNVGVNPSSPLQRCEGDCDSDSDCASSDLFCYPRSVANTRVPGCSGGKSDDSLFDYCIRRVDVPLRSFPTSDPTPVPFPSPTPVPSSDPISYPFPTDEPTPDASSPPASLPASVAPIQVPTADPSSPPITPTQPGNTVLPLKFTKSFPLGRCEGDCDDDNDCEGNLICFQRDEYDPVPNCSGGLKDRSKTDYCIRSTDAPERIPLSITQTFPLGRCEGDCDDDDDCEGGLICFQRNENESVPGCLGGSKDRSKTDYCTPPLEAIRPPLEVTQTFPLGRCEGDCDSDNDCESGLVCFQRDENESVPTCSGGSRDSSRSDYCIPPSNTPVLPLKFAHSFPLGLCEGDCDNDDDCESGLICHQRNENESVRGCSGGSKDASKTDYCIHE
eukprot:scaffold175_cov153-Cylindrotheca_fusiformis.AAC.6